MTDGTNKYADLADSYDADSGQLSDLSSSPTDEALAAGANPNSGALADTAPPSLPKAQPANPYAAVAEDYNQPSAADLEAAEKETQLRSSLAGVVDQNPDQAASAQRLARQQGDDPLFALHDPAWYLKEKRVDDALEKTLDAPILQKWLSLPENAVTAHDDVPELASLEDRIRLYGRDTPMLDQMGYSLKRGWLSEVAGVATQLGVARLPLLPYLDRIDKGEPLNQIVKYLPNGEVDPQATGGPLSPGDVQLLQRYYGSPDERADMRRDITSTAAGMFTSAVQANAKAAALPQHPSVGAINDAVNDGRYADALRMLAQHPVAYVGDVGLSSLPTIAPAIGVGLLNPPAGIATMAAADAQQEFGSSVLDYLASQKINTTDAEAVTAALNDPETLKAATSYAAKRAFVIGAFDVASGALAGRSLVPAKLITTPAVREAVNAFIAEPVVQGALGAAGEASAQYASTGKINNRSAILGEFAGEFSGAPLETLTFGKERIAEALHKTDQAPKAAQGLGAVMAAAAGSKLLKRDPEALAGLVQLQADANNAPAVYIDAQAFAQTVQQTPEVMAKLPSVGPQLAEAAATGGDLRIPTGELTAAIAGTPLQEALLQHIRTSPDQLSIAQAEELKASDFSDLRSQADQVLNEHGAQAEEQRSADTVYLKVLEQLGATNRFTPEVNQQYATLTREFFKTLANRLGITPEQAFEQYPLNVKGAPILGEGLDQRGADIETPEFKKWFGDSHVVDAEGKPQVIYHGTDEDFSTFDKEKIGTRTDAGELGSGFYFATDARVSKNFKSVMPVYLSLKKPLKLTLPSIASDKAAVVREALGLERSVSASDVAEAAKGAGYDGIELDYSPAGYNGKELVAFEPEQIKSASGNRGTFDANDPNILHQAREVGPFGPILREFHHDAAGAVAALQEMEAGEAIAALHHPSVGDIDLMWGEEGTNADDGYGLAKILKWHPEVADNLQSILDGLEVVSKTKNRVQLDSPDHRAAVRLEWDGQAKHWLLTAFAKRKGSAQGATTSTASTEAGGDTARPDDAPTVNIEQRPLDLKTLRQAAAAGARGFFSPSTGTIALLKDADLSTYLHELGHFFLTTYADVSSRPGTTPEIGDDMKAVLKWFGVKDLATWNAMTLEQQRGSHEKFARGFEAYLFSGEAPNPELHTLFRRFADWLVAVYRSIKALNVSLTSEVRGVMDRMLASRDQITQAERLRNYRPLFESAETAGMTPEQFTAYQELGAQATATAEERLEKRSVQEMKWAATAKAKALRKIQKDTRAKRAAAEEQVTDDVRRQPVYAVQRFLSHGELPAEHRSKKQRRALDEASLSGAKLSIPTLKEMYGDGWPSYFANAGKHALAAENGTHPAIIAEAFGFTSADEMVNAIVRAEPEASVIEGVTDQRMLERYGDIQSPEAQERAAEEAIHNEVRGRFVAAELKALQDANDAKVQVGTDKRGRPISTNLIVRAAKQFAVDAVSARKVRDLLPGRTAAAETKAAKAAEVALREGDLARAAAAKRQEIVAHHTTIETLKAVVEVDKALDYFRRLQTSAARAKIDPEYTAQIDALLERYDMRKSTTVKALAKRQSLLEWVEAQRELGIEPPIDPELLRQASTTSYKDATMRELRGLRDSIKVIEHLGRLKAKLLTAKDQREFDAIKTTIVDSIRDHAGDRHVDPSTVNTAKAERSRGLKSYFYEHLKVATLARVLDGGKDGGPMWEYFVRPMNDAANNETTWRAKAAREVTRILAPLLQSGGLRKGETFFPELGVSLNREAVLAVALNVGNEGNLQRLLDGGVRGSGPIQPAQLRSVLDTLTKEEWGAIQQLWDHVESWRPEIAAKEMRVNGVEPEWVEPTPVETKFGTLRGGYYPIKYDPAASIRAEEHADAEAARQSMRAAYTTATTRRTFTKARVDEVHGRSLLLSLDGLYAGLNEVVHDLAWHEWLIDANRITKNGEIDRTIRTTYGPEFKGQFKSLLDDIARGDAGAETRAEKIAGVFRRNIVRSGLAFNVTNALQQITGLAPATARVGGRFMTRAVGRLIANPAAMYRESTTASQFMHDRARTRMRELNEVRNQVKGQNRVGRWYDRSAYVLMLTMQQVVDNVTWSAAREKALLEGSDDARAAALADQTVIDTQGSGLLKDLSRVERAPGIAKLLTTYYGYFNTQLNLTVAQTMTAQSRAKLATDYLLIYAIPAAISAGITSALVPAGGSGDDWLRAYARETGSQLMGSVLNMLTLVRELSNVVTSFTFGDGAPYSGPTGFRWVQDVAKTGDQAKQGELDSAFFRSLVSLIGDITGAPSVAINRTIKGAEALVDGDTSNPLALVTGYRH